MATGAISPATENPGAAFQPVDIRGRGRARARYRGSRPGRSRPQNRGVLPVPGTANVEVVDRGPRGTWAGLFSSHIISPEEQPTVPLGHLVSPPEQVSRRQGTDWMDQLARDMSELVVQPVTVPPQEQAGRPPPQPVSTTQQGSEWVNRLMHGMRELAAQQQPPESPVPTPAPAAQRRRGGLEPGLWGVQYSPSSNTNTNTSPTPPTPPMSLNQLAEDASILLELFSQNPHDTNDISDEDQTMINSAAASIAVIQARCVRKTRHTESREEINRDADCIICFAERAEVVFMPCKHLVVCAVRTPPPPTRKSRYGALMDGLDVLHEDGD